MAWENVRLLDFPHRPSRLGCLLFWADEACGRDFYFRRPWPVGLYEVEVIECTRVFVADMNLISYFDKSETIATMWERAKRYWETEVENGEVLSWVLLESRELSSSV